LGNTKRVFIIMLLVGGFGICIMGGLAGLNGWIRADLAWVLGIGGFLIAAVQLLLLPRFRGDR
jgi:hypothetical protein